jgi:hypothetical protein
VNENELHKIKNENEVIFKQNRELKLTILKIYYGTIEIENEETKRKDYLHVKY